MKLSLQTRLMIATGMACVVIAGVAAAGAPSEVVAATALGFGGVLIGAVYWLLRPYERLHEAAREALQQAPRLAGEPTAEPTEFAQAGGDGTEQLEGTIWFLLERLNLRHAKLTERETQFKDALTQLQSALRAIISDGKSAVPTLALKSPWAELNKLVADDLLAVARHASQLHRRAQTLYAIINELPEALLVCDDKLGLVLTNTAANKLLRTVDVKTPTRLTDIFVANPEQRHSDPDLPTPIGVKQIGEMVMQSRGNQFVALANDGVNTPISVRMLPAGQRMQKGMRVLLARDASGDITSTLETRLRNRRDVGLRMCLLVNKEAGETLESIRTQAGLLSQAAKQVGQRDKFLPKITRLLDDLSKHEAVVNLLGWLGRLNRTEATVPDIGEVRLKDVVENAADNLKSLFAERSNTFSVHGDAGWIVADEEWITVMLTGLFLHVNHSMQESEIRCEMRRRTGSDTRLRAECSEVSIVYKGEPLSAELLADIHDPFGRVNSLALAPAGTAGFPLGLAVAARVARLMNGDIIAESDGNMVHLRVLIPTREQDSHVMMTTHTVRALSDSVEVDTSGTLGGWMIGGAPTPDVHDDDRSEDPAEPVGAPVGSPAASHAPDEPAVNHDSFDNWFGSPSN